MCYTLNMDYKSIAKLSPYPIYVGLTNYYVGEFHHGPHVDFNPHIKINNNLSDIQKLATLLHELAHAKHHYRKCICYVKNDRYLKELHAYRFVLRFAMRYKLIDILKCEYKKIAFNTGYPNVYYEVFKQIKTQKIWEKVEKILDIQ